MPKYLIERTVPGVGQMDTAALAAIANESNTGAPRPRTRHPVGAELRHRRQDHVRLRGRLRGDSSASTAAVVGFLSTPCSPSATSSTRPPRSWSDEPGGDQPDHRPRGSGEGDRRPPRGGRRRRERPGHSHVLDQGGRASGHRGCCSGCGVRRVPVDTGADAAPRGGRRRIARLSDLLQRQEARRD